MLSLGEIQHNTSAAWALFLNDRTATHRLDMSVTGFWRSFLVIFLITPLYLISCFSEVAMVAENMAGAHEVALAPFLVSRFLALGLDWIALPFVLMLLAGPLGIGARYVPFVIVRNWSLFVMALLMTPLFFLHVIGILSSGLLALLLLAAAFVFIRYRFIGTRATLDCSTSFAMGIVLLEYLGGVLLSLGMAQLFSA